jgi:hypothetical protein
MAQWADIGKKKQRLLLFKGYKSDVEGNMCRMGKSMRRKLRSGKS